MPPEEEYLRALRVLELDKINSTIVKSHIVIEQKIREILQDYFIHPKFFQKTNLTINPMINLTRAACFSYAEDPVWTLINHITKARNKVAHNLNHPDRDSILKNMRDLYNNIYQTQAKNVFFWSDKTDISSGIHFVTITCLAFLIQVHKEILGK